MSSPRYQWWGYVKSMVRRYPDRVNQDEYAAVTAALAETEAMNNGAERLKVVRMMMQEEPCKLAYVALRIPCSESTAQRYHAEFLRTVGRNFHCDGLM